jgi:hypothetical protein
MLHKSQHTAHQKKVSIPKAPPLILNEEVIRVSLEPAMAQADPAPVVRPVSRISAAKSAVQDFLSAELGAREIRITRLAPLNHGAEGWEAEAEILVPNLEVKMLNLPLTQEVFELEQYVVELDPDYSVRSYAPLGANVE